MLGRAGTALATIALALGAAAEGETDGDRGAPAAGRHADVCELRGADRSRTPSVRCMGCHDGSAGASIDYRMVPDGTGMSHPVEVDYGAAHARRPDRFAPPETLPREVPLVGGRIACTSCHDGSSPDPKRVARVADLCLACHRM
jgi:predicted CXXCH cytochrome family protein